MPLLELLAPNHDASMPSLLETSEYREQVDLSPPAHSARYSFAQPGFVGAREAEGSPQALPAGLGRWRNLDS